MPSLILPDRRLLLKAGATFTAALMTPRIASAAGARDPRLIVVILRGALDGLSAAPPVGDPAYAALRPDIRLTADGAEPALSLDSTFALHPSLKTLHAMAKAGEASLIHAVASPYRERSHFDGQDALENGTPTGRGADTGWLNRAVAAMPSGGRAKPVEGLAVGPSVPLILRGPAATVSWTPPRLQAARADTLDRLAALYAARDPELGKALEAGVAIDRMAAAGPGMTDDAGRGRQNAAFAMLAEGAARLMAGPEGPRVAALGFDGWDTHVREGSADGRLANLLTALDGAFAAMKRGLGEAWKETAVVVVTEFGRTARENGADGTDHGTGAAAFLLGGAVKGGRVVADWPGLSERDLYEGRDLKPTTDLRAVLKGVLADHLGLSEAVLGRDVFPGSADVKPMKGLIA